MLFFTQQIYMKFHIKKKMEFFLVHFKLNCTQKREEMHIGV